MPVTERTIINWCNPNKRGVVRMNCYFDEGDGKYFITPQSIEQVIKEESPRAKPSQHTPFASSKSEDGISESNGKASEERPKVSETVPKDSESFGTGAEGSDTNGGSKDEAVRQLRQQLMDEKILNKGKDFFIEQLQKDRESFASERRELIQQMVLQGERIGKLATELRQLQAPRQNGGVKDQTTNQNENGEESHSAGGRLSENESGQRERWPVE